MNFTLHQLNVFGMVAHHGSMTKAAKQLHLTQPAVSIQVKQLQDAIDIPLIEIVGRKIYLTDAGQHLYRIYQNISDELESFEATVSELKGGLKGKLTISAASTAKYFLPYLLGEFNSRYPGVEISLKVTNRNEVLRALRNNEHDVAILTQVPQDDSIHVAPFLENPLVMCASPEHPMAGRKNISLEELRQEPFIYRESGSGTRMVMEKYLKDRQITVHPVMELGTNEAVKQAIMAGIGISLISRLSLENERRLNQISILDMEQLPIMSHWQALYKKEKNLTPVTRNFLSFLQEENIGTFLPWQPI